MTVLFLSTRARLLTVLSGGRLLVVATPLLRLPKARLVATSSRPRGHPIIVVIRGYWWVEFAIAQKIRDIDLLHPS